MSRALSIEPKTLTNIASLSVEEMVVLVQSQALTITDLKKQIEWFQRQIFGSKRERFAPTPDLMQMHLGEVFPVPESVPEERQVVPAHTRRVAKTDLANTEESVPFFDESRVPMETIMVIDAEIKALDAAEYAVIGEKVSYRLAQRPGSYVVLKVVRPLIKRLDLQTLHCPPAPVGVLEGSRADVSLVAGLLIDKFAYHRVL